MFFYEENNILCCFIPGEAFGGRKNQVVEGETYSILLVSVKDVKVKWSMFFYEENNILCCFIPGEAFGGRKNQVKSALLHCRVVIND